MKNMIHRAKVTSSHGMTLIELVIVMTVVGILLISAMPSYRSYMLRVHRSEAIRVLLQVSMCQQRIHASTDHYDTSLCLPTADQPRYRISYPEADGQGLTYVAMATPIGAQRSDPCGNLSLDQNGGRTVSAMGTSVMKCWSSR